MILGVKLWWMTLSLVSMINIIAWFYSARLFAKRRSTMDPNIIVWRRLLLWLSAGYVFGCAFRSILPRIDLERICLVNTWLSSVIVGRSVATVAEVCFIAQCAVLLREAGIGAGDRFAVMISYLLIPMILVAECCSWYASISTNYLGSVVEESIWTMAGVLLVVSFTSLWPRAWDHQRYFLLAMIVFAVGYVLYMVTFDVPMYWRRWELGVSHGHHYLSLKPGLLDMLRRYTVSFEWQSWREEVSWMTLYFTVAVWVSIFLTHAPNFKLDRPEEG